MAGFKVNLLLPLTWWALSPLKELVWAVLHRGRATVWSQAGLDRRDGSHLGVCHFQGLAGRLQCRCPLVTKWSSAQGKHWGWAEGPTVGDLSISRAP